MYISHMCTSINNACFGFVLSLILHVVLLWFAFFIRGISNSRIAASKQPVDQSSCLQFQLRSHVQNCRELPILDLLAWPQDKLLYLLDFSTTSLGFNFFKFVKSLGYYVSSVFQLLKFCCLWLLFYLWEIML